MLSELQKNLDNNTKSEQNNEFCFVRFLFQSVSLRYFHLIVYLPKIYIFI